MVLDLGSKRSASNGILNRNSSGFVPVEAPEGSVEVVVLQRKRTGDDNESDPRQRIPGRNGNNTSTVRNQVILDLVGVIVDGVCYPDYKNETELPELGSPEYLKLVSRPIGLEVESIYADGLAKLRKAIVDKVPGINIDLNEFDKAVENNTVNQLFNTAGAAMRQFKITQTHQLTIGDILFGSKSLSVQLLPEGMGDAYAESFTELRGKLGFPNVAFVAAIGKRLQVTDLTVNGIITPTYTPDGMYFEWVKTTVGGRTTYKLNPDYAISGSYFAVGATTAANASELARRGVSSQHQGQVQSTSYRTGIRDANKVLRDALGGGQRGANAVPAGGYDDSGL